jgi:hypothetical protein
MHVLIPRLPNFPAPNEPEAQDFGCSCAPVTPPRPAKTPSWFFYSINCLLHGGAVAEHWNQIDIIDLTDNDL